MNDPDVAVEQQEASLRRFLDDVYPRLPALSKTVPDAIRRSGLDSARLFGLGPIVRRAAEYGLFIHQSESAMAELETARNMFEKRHERQPGGFPDFGLPSPDQMLPFFCYEQEGFANGRHEAAVIARHTLDTINAMLDKHLGDSRGR